jgi:hypothetical protein
MNTPMSVPPNGGGGLRQRLLRGTLLKWNEVDGYHGVQPLEGPYLLWGMDNGYQRCPCPHVRLIRPLQRHRLLHVPLRRASRKRRTAWRSSTKSNRRRFVKNSTTTCPLGEGAGV